MKIMLSAVPTGSLAPALLSWDYTEKSLFTDSEIWRRMVYGQLGKLRQVREEALRNGPRACQLCVCVFSEAVMEKPAARSSPGSSCSGFVGSLIIASLLVRRIGLKVSRIMKIVGEFHPYTGHLRATFGECLPFPAIRTIAIIEGIVQS